MYLYKMHQCHGENVEKWNITFILPNFLALPSNITFSMAL